MLIDSDLSEGFLIGKAIEGRDCFFDAVAQGLKQLKPGTNFTVKSLREVCEKQALEILDVIAYLASDNIPMEEIFSNLISNKEKRHSAVKLLDQYSIS